jgi:DNA excision repair protein ERCC-3
MAPDHVLSFNSPLDNDKISKLVFIGCSKESILMSYIPGNPLIVQSDGSILLEVDNPRYEGARDELIRFAELEKSPEHIHTYRLTPLSLWNAAASGETDDAIVDTLERYSKFELPSNVVTDVRDYVSRYGRLKLLRSGEDLILRSTDKLLLTEVWHNKTCREFLVDWIDENTLKVDSSRRGHIKQALVHFGFPAEDLAGYVEGTHLTIELREIATQGLSFHVRDYQGQAIESFYCEGSSRGGSGVIALPCGSGKTVIGMGIMERLQSETLILCSNTVAVRQWISELLDKTSLTPDQVGEYTGDKKEIRPVTVTTYQIMTYHGPGGGGDNGHGDVEGDFPHLELFTSKNWGLIIYDEVHLLPAPVFRITAEIQARRRLGLTATLVREDGRETDVFSLIGPKRFDMPWKDLEKQGWIATAECQEVRLPLHPDMRMAYSVEDDARVKYRLAAENPLKLQAALKLIERHQGDRVLIIGQYLDQLKALAEDLKVPLITGRTPNGEREVLYERFRHGDLKLLIVSKVANFSIDLPDANVAIQVSGTFGSRQEEAQRLGRILRPKSNGGPAFFYSLVTKDTREQEFSVNRQLFLTEQGYHSTIVDGSALIEDLVGGAGK